MAARNTISQPAPQLEVLIATHGVDGAEKVAAMNLPYVDKVRYIVTWQLSENASIPQLLQRPDVEVHRVASVGLGANRDEGLQISTAPLCLIADNDLLFLPGAFEKIIAAFERYPDLSVATFKYRASGETKAYPCTETDFNDKMPKGYCVASFEIAVRRCNVWPAIKFDETFGVGTDYPATEDPLFILDCRRAGLRCRFFPITICEHLGVTTGNRPITHNGVAIAEGAYIRAAYGLSGYLRVPLKAWRLFKAQHIGFWKGLYLLNKGFFSNLSVRHRK